MASPTDDSDAAAALAYLRSPRAVRERCRMVLAAGEAGALRHFVVRMERLDHAADRVLDEIRLGYPDLVIPYHSRWRHFVVDGVDRWAARRSSAAADRAVQARRASPRSRSISCPKGKRACTPPDILQIGRAHV